MSAASDPPFFHVVVRQLDDLPGLMGVCAGYEQGEWRYRQLANYLMDWMPEFCLTYSEFQAIDGANATAKLRKSAGRVYKTDKFKNRGEFGELILHAILRQEFKTLPAISKLFYKDSSNDTVKGFDAVHVIPDNDELQLWLGEAKFYDDAKQAIRDVIAEIDVHTKTDYLRQEFVAIENKLDPGWPHAEKLRGLLHENTSLDKVFSAVCIPVLVTYDSATTKAHTIHSDAYFQEIAREFSELYDYLRGKELPDLRIYVFFLPLATKELLIKALDEKLKAWQQI